MGIYHWHYRGMGALVLHLYFSNKELRGDPSPCATGRQIFLCIYLFDVTLGLETKHFSLYIGKIPGVLGGRKRHLQKAAKGKTGSAFWGTLWDLVFFWLVCGLSPQCFDLRFVSVRFVFSFSCFIITFQVQLCTNKLCWTIFPAQVATTTTTRVWVAKVTEAGRNRDNSYRAGPRGNSPYSSGPNKGCRIQFLTSRVL